MIVSIRSRLIHDQADLATRSKQVRSKDLYRVLIVGRKVVEENDGHGGCNEERESDLPSNNAQGEKTCSSKSHTVKHKTRKTLSSPFIFATMEVFISLPFRPQREHVGGLIRHICRAS